jgi:amidophosphoribosyltransferase
VRWPCFYGIDFATRAELIATGIGVEEVCNSIGADSLGYISEEGMIAATEQEPEKLCSACFTGTYPIELPSSDRLGKGLLELEFPVDEGITDATETGTLDVDRVSVTASGGAAEAVRRP